MKRGCYKTPYEQARAAKPQHAAKRTHKRLIKPRQEIFDGVDFDAW
jgi:hypothetical protein